MSPQSTTTQRDTTAVVALVLAFLVPLAGLLLAVYGPRKGDGGGNLRTAAVAVGVIGTILWTMLLVWGLAIGTTQE